jgi:hypothetical protein
VRVGPLTNLTTVKFTVVAYDPTKFTTAQNNETGVGGQTAPLHLSNISFTLPTGEFSFAWPAPAGVTNPANLTDTVQRSPTLTNDWAVVLGAVIAITNGIVTFSDPTPPAVRAFYRVARP